MSIQVVFMQLKSENAFLTVKSSFRCKRLVQCQRLVIYGCNNKTLKLNCVLSLLYHIALPNGILEGPSFRRSGFRDVAVPGEDESSIPP